MAAYTRKPFDKTKSCELVEELTLDNGTLCCQILTFGATLRGLCVPGRDGQRLDVVLGYDNVAQYEAGDAYLGAVVGRVANRIAGGRFRLGGQAYRLAVNNGPNHLHGGLVGYSHRVWTVETLEDSRVVLTLDSPDGEEGYPGHVQVRVTYSVEGGALTIAYEARSDRDTPLSLTNHSYFNLSGHGSGPVLDQEVSVRAAYYTPTDATQIPTGALEPVEGTPMDLRRLTPIGAGIDAPFEQLQLAGGYDHNWVIDGQPGVLRPAARARSAKSGVTLSVDTTLPGVQLYTGNFLEEGQPGKGGARYGRRHGFCLETQLFPDSPNHPEFPSAILRAGEVYAHATRFSFGVEKG